MTELEQHIRAKNDKTRAWVAEDPDNRWAMLPVEDAAHWAEYGVHTVAEYELFNARAELWDVYKDIHGIRPRWMGVWDMPLEAVQAELESLYAEARAEREAEEAEATAHEKAVRDALSQNPLVQRLEIA